MGVVVYVSRNVPTTSSMMRSDHEAPPTDALPRDGEDPERRRPASAAACKKRFMHRREDHDHEQRLEPAEQRLQRDLRERELHASRTCSHERRRHIESLGDETARRYRAPRSDELRARVEPVDDGIAGEILAERDVLQHAACPPFRASSSAFELPPRYRPPGRSAGRGSRSAQERSSSPAARRAPSRSSSSARANTSARGAVHREYAHR